MGGAIGPGDWVECIDASPMHCIPTGLTEASVYCVEALTPSRAYGGQMLGEGLLLVGIRHPGNPLGDYATRRFRPIYRPKSCLIEGLLKPADTPAEPERVNA